ncbi:NAD(P)H-dependent FMN reductase [Williamsia limnetica]|jgi:NAD(P)H-dependent FMN reductase|uniref:NAD(P)H-dependent FMN reductase n=1 Tax=Williamsia limnetica TaxID=882452 RepID=A0A318RZ00_WILLI|nr:NADPH-dependent FMN reductase [Williamsia limnetica]PYE19185.1 NAD(P)H-dependent FMN reductase [Williamsia limnetica]
MKPTPLNFVSIIASVRTGRIGPDIARWFLEQIDAGGPEFEVIDLAEPTGAGTTRMLEHADGFVIVTPEYNHSYPGELKILIDAHRSEWKHKPVMFVSYGGMSGGLRAVEHLRTVFAELYAVGTRNGVVIHAPWSHVDDGILTLDDTAAASARQAMDELIWWAELLKPERPARARGVA